jgi:hypothetical protein
MLMEAAIPSGCFSDIVNNFADFATAEQINHVTPDTAADNGYRLFLSSVSNNVAKFVSFFNTVDFALQTGTTSIPFQGLAWPFQTNWVQNEIDYKPNRFFNATLDYYDFLPNASQGQRSVFFFNGTSVRSVIDAHETMAFVARPRSKSAGAEGNTSLVFPSSFDLQGACNFGRQRDDHSGQFTRRIQQLSNFYDRVFSEIK